MSTWAGWNDATKGIGSGGHSLALNPCDSVVHYPYYLGHIAAAAVQCTDTCPILTWPDSAQVCHPCALPGCASCSERECNSCLILHAQFKGQCVFFYALFFIAIVILALAVCCIGILRLGGMHVAGNRNPRVLEQGLLHRKRAKAHEYAVAGNPLYDFDSTNVRQGNSVAGIAYAMYFRFLLLLCALALTALPFLLLFSSLPDLVGPDELSSATRYWGIAIYAGLLLVWGAWSASQNGAIREDASNVHMRNYVVVATGFPKSARSPHEIKTYFEAVLGFEVEGVSIAYDFSEEHTFVIDRLNHLLEKADVELAVYGSDLAAAERVNESQDGHVLDCILNAGAAFVVFEREADREFALRRFHEIEVQHEALGRTGATGKKSGVGVHDEEDVNEDGVGVPRSRNVLFRGKHRVSVSPAPEASSVLWANFRTGARGGKIVQLAIAWLFTLVVVITIGSVVFAPAVLYELSLRNLAAASITQAQAALGQAERAIVSASITLLNRVLVSVLLQGVRGTGFLQQPHQDSVAVIVALSIVLVQLFFFLVVAGIVGGVEHLQLLPELVTSELFQLLWMSALLAELEYAGAPALAYIQAFYSVRRSRYVSAREAELLLDPPPFPLVKVYVDAIAHSVLFAAMLVANPASSYTLGGCCFLLLHTAYTYLAHKYRFLRTYRYQAMTSPKVDLTAQYCFIVPLVLFSLLPLKAAAAVLDPWTSLSIGLANALLLVLAVRAYHAKPPPREWTDVPYVEVAAQVPWNFFNTNPVHVLRTIHFPSIVVPPVYAYAPGKEYMQGGMFADYDDAVRLQEALMMILKNPLKDLAPHQAAKETQLRGME